MNVSRWNVISQFQDVFGIGAGTSERIGFWERSGSGFGGGFGGIFGKGKGVPNTTTPTGLIVFASDRMGKALSLSEYFYAASQCAELLIGEG